jgi:hypothetical protein
MTVRHVASAAGSANPTTSFTITIPAACAAGDDLYVLATSRGHTSGTAKATISDNDTGGNSWTEVTSSTNRQLMLWHKKATSGTASKTITVSGCVDSSAGGVSVFRGGASGDPTTNVSLQSNISGAESHTGFTPTNDNSFVCLGVCNTANDNDVSAQAATNPATITERFDHLSTGGNDCGCMLAGALQVGTKGATGSLTWAQTNGTTESVAFAIAPDTTGPQVRGVASGTNSTGTATATIPSSVVTGDVLFAVCQANLGTAACTDNDTGGNAWTSIAGDANLNVFWKRATSGTAGKTVTNASGGGSRACVLIIAYQTATVDSGATPYSDATLSNGTTNSRTGFTPDAADSVISLALVAPSTSGGGAGQSTTDPGALNTVVSQVGFLSGATTLSVEHQVGGPTATGNFTWTAPGNGTTANVVMWAVLPAASVVDKTATDSLLPKLTEAAATLLASLARTESLTPKLTEGTSAILASLSRADTTSPKLTEAAAGLFASLARTDSTLVLLSDLAAVMVPLSAVDSALLRLDEATAIAVIVAAADTSSLTLAETAAIFALLSRSDTAPLLLTETRTILASLAVADALSISLTDAATVLAAVSASDTLTPGILAELAQIAAVLASADTLAMTLTEAAVILAMLARADSTLITLSETAQILAFLSRVDSLSLTAAEVVTILGALSRSDAASLTLSDASSVLVAISRADSLGLLVDGEAAIGAVLDLVDELGVILGEAALAAIASAIKAIASMRVEALAGRSTTDVFAAAMNAIASTGTAAVDVKQSAQEIEVAASGASIEVD